MAIFLRGEIWWYKFYFAGQFIGGVVEIDLKKLSPGMPKIRDGASSKRFE